MTSCHLIPTWQNWSVNAGDVMVMWFASYGNLVTSHWACMSCMHMHGTHAIIKNGAPKDLSGLAGMQAYSNGYYTGPVNSPAVKNRYLDNNKRTNGTSESLCSIEYGRVGGLGTKKIGRILHLLHT